MVILLVRVTQQVFRIETRCPHLQEELPRKEFGTFFLLCRYTWLPLKLTCLQWTTIQLHWKHALWKKKKLIQRYASSSRQHPMNISWRTELYLNAPPFSGKSGPSQLSLVTPTAFTHTLTNPPNLCCWLSMHESFCINKASVLTAFTSHHTQDIMAERQNISKAVPIICRIQNNQFQVKPNNLWNQLDSKFGPLR